MPEPLLHAVHAMNCRFELALHGDDRVRLGAVAQEAEGEIRRVESQLNFFSPQSEISRVNRWAAERPVKVQRAVYLLLERCRKLWELTGGAFDPTVSPLLRLWGWYRKQGRIPPEDELREALRCVGMGLVELNREKRTVRFLRPGVSINLGSIGKGYALDRAAEVLAEFGVSDAFVQAGRSSAVGLPARAWKVAVANPLEPESGRIAVVELRGRSLGVAGACSNVLEAEGRRFGHILDPATGRPVGDRLTAAVSTRSAADADALSTALLCRGESLMSKLPGVEFALCMRRDGTVWRTGEVSLNTSDVSCCGPG
jgi:FAD:protein FMN transferase